MNTNKKTYTEILNYINGATKYLDENKDNHLTYAIKKTRPAITKVVDKYNEELDEIERKHCTVTNDEYKTILKDEKGNFRFTPGKQGLRNKDVRALLNQEQEIPVHYTPEDRIPANLSSFYRQLFEGFVIEPEAPNEEQTDEKPVLSAVNN